MAFYHAKFVCGVFISLGGWAYLPARGQREIIFRFFVARSCYLAWDRAYSPLVSPYYRFSSVPLPSRYDWILLASASTFSLRGSYLVSPHSVVLLEKTSIYSQRFPWRRWCHETRFSHVRRTSGIFAYWRMQTGYFWTMHQIFAMLHGAYGNPALLDWYLVVDIFADFTERESSWIFDRSRYATMDFFADKGGT